MPRAHDDADFEGTLTEVLKELDEQGYDHPTPDEIMLQSKQAVDQGHEPGPWICQTLVELPVYDNPVMLVRKWPGRYAIEGE